MTAMRPERDALARLFESSVEKAMDDAQARLADEQGPGVDWLVVLSAWALLLEGAQPTADKITELARELSPSSNALHSLATKVFLVGPDGSSMMESAVRVFGTVEGALDWLFAANTALGGNTPASLLSQPEGTTRVSDLLGRIEHGVFS